LLMRMCVQRKHELKHDREQDNQTASGNAATALKAPDHECTSAHYSPGRFSTVSSDSDLMEDNNVETGAQLEVGGSPTLRSKRRCPRARRSAAICRVMDDLRKRRLWRGDTHWFHPRGQTCRTDGRTRCRGVRSAAHAPPRERAPGAPRPARTR